MNLDFLISRAGIRVAALDVQVTGLRLARGTTSFAPQSAERITGTMTVGLAISPPRWPAPRSWIR